MQRSNKSNAEGQLYPFQCFQVWIWKGRQNKDEFWVSWRKLCIWSIWTMDKCLCQLGSEWKGMKYRTGVHGLLSKQEAGDLKPLWLLLLDPVGTDQLTDSLLCWFHLWPFEGDAVPTRFLHDLIHIPSSHPARSVLYTAFTIDSSTENM